MSEELVPHEVASRMMLAVNWDPADFKVRDRITSAIADECDYRNRKRKERERSVKPVGAPITAKDVEG